MFTFCHTLIELPCLVLSSGCNGGQLRALSDCVLYQQASTPWRKATAKLEGEPEYEDLSKIDRLEVFDEYMRSVTTFHKCHIS